MRASVQRDLNINAYQYSILRLFSRVQFVIIYTYTYFLNDRLKITDRLIARVIAVYALHPSQNRPLPATSLCIASRVGRVLHDLTATNMIVGTFILLSHRFLNTNPIRIGERKDFLRSLEILNVTLSYEHELSISHNKLDRLEID